MINSNDIFKVKSDEDFEAMALEVFHFQASYNNIYKQYINLLGKNPLLINNIADIPFLPIQFFKTKKVYSANKQADIVFTSSGTSGAEAAKHAVANVSIYEESFNKGFHQFYGNPEEYAILALLPAYLERQGSSLIYMVEHLISKSKYPQSGFFLHNLQQLYNSLKILQEKGVPTILIGVSFALLDFIENYQIQYPELIIMETGGMKGRRREIPREELHEILCKSFGVNKIHSEYGMTELLSQAYSKGDGRFYTPPWMRIMIRDVQNPLVQAPNNVTGGINIIDLANVYSCSFIETQDLGKLHLDKGFSIQGRFDNSDVRGCNLLLIE